MLLYSIIKSKSQYNEYCNTLIKLLETPKKTIALQEEIELLTLLIEKYDNEHTNFKPSDPIVILKSLMKEHKLKAVNVAELLQVSKGLISDILNYKKGLSKDVIRKLAEHFKMSQEAFNTPYVLKNAIPLSKRKTRIKAKKRKMVIV